MSGTGEGGGAPTAPEVLELTQELAQLRGQVQALTAQRRFAYSTAQLQTGNNYIDYGTKNSSRIFQAATAPMSKEPFDGEASRLASFKSSILARATISGWDSTRSDIMNIPVSDRTNKDLVKQYPLIKVSEIKDWANANFIAKQNWMAQNNFNMYTALEQSVSSKFKSEEILFKEEE